MPDSAYSVLLPCSGNSARSILAGAYLENRGRGGSHACSAGSHPAGHVDSSALDLRQRCDMAGSGLHGKSWEEASATADPRLDFAFTVCNRAAGELFRSGPASP